MRKILVSVICLLPAFCIKAQLTAAQITYAGHTINFYQFKPPHYNSNNPTRYPLIVSLHGGGEAGDGSSDPNRGLPNVKKQSLPLLLDEGATMEFSFKGQQDAFIVLAPQSPDGFWQGEEYYIDAMIDYGIANLHVDADRVFLTGYSLGGGGSWSYPASSATAAQRLAGTAPISTVGSVNNLCNIANNQVATWAFHAYDDQVTGDHGAITTNYTNTVNSCSPLIVPAVDTIYPDGSHGIYNFRTYDTTNNTHYPNLFQWMMKVNRNLDPATNQNPVPVIAGAPTINLTTPVKLRDFPVLDGSGSTDDDIIIDYLWEQTGGPMTLFPSNNTTERIRQYPTTTILPPAGTPVGVTEGTYTFRLRVKDYLTTKPGHTQFATLTVNVQLPISGHSAPAVDAGDDHLLTSGERYWQQQGAYKFYGSSFSSSPFNWRFLSGPATAAVNNYNGGPYPGDDNNVRFVNMDTPGDYFFEFSVTNNFSEIGRDTIKLTRLAALPVTYSYFRGDHTGSKNILSWATTAEVNSERFDIQRSTDGINFAVIGSVTSKGGSALTTYSFDDNNAPVGLAYYRLSQVDKDGRSALSQTVSVNNRKTGLYIEKYPNPVHDNLNVTVQGNTNGVMQVLIADMQGKTILQQQWQKDLSVLKRVINVASLQNGVYQMIVIIGQEKQVSSFVKY